LQIVAVYEGLRGDFRVVAMSACVEKTFVVWILAWIENVVAFCAGTKGCHAAVILTVLVKYFKISKHFHFQRKYLFI
jgi:hypothetical protein